MKQGMAGCTLCTLGDPPGYVGCRAVEPEGEPAPSIVYRVVHVPTGEWYICKHKLPEEWADPDYRERMAAIQRTPEVRAANRERGIARMAAMTPEECRELMAPATAVTHTPGSYRRGWANATDEERAARIKKATEARRRAVEERRRRAEPAVKPPTDEVLPARSVALRERFKDPAQHERQGKNSRTYHASLDPEAKARWVESIREGKARAKAERERVRREVQMILVALLVQRYGTA